MTKHLLKKARSALDSKNFNDALGCCDAVLETDPQNYHAYVFKGFACFELGSFDDAKLLYMRAIKVAPSELLAYKGLIRLCENSGRPIDEESLPSLYQEYASLIENNNFESFCEINIKHLNILKKLTRYEELFSLLQTLETKNVDVDFEFQYLSAILNVNVLELSEENTNIAFNLLEIALHSEQTVFKVFDILKSYCQLCWKMRYFSFLEDILLKNLLTLECRLFVADQLVKLFLNKCCMSMLVNWNISEFKALFTEHSEILKESLLTDSPFIIQCSFLLRFDFYCDSTLDIDKLQKILHSLENNKCEILFLFLNLLAFFHFHIVGKVFQNSLTLKTAKYCNITTSLIKHFLMYVKGSYLYNLTQYSACIEEFVSLGDEISSAILKDNVMFYIGQAFINVQQIEKAEIILSQISTDSPYHTALSLSIFVSQDKCYSDHISLIRGIPLNMDCPIVCLAKAVALFKCGEDIHALLDIINECYKSDIYFPMFYNLHSVILRGNDNEVSLQCIEKVYAIDSANIEIAKTYCDQLLLTNREADAKVICENFIDNFDGSSCKWAFFKLGLIYLKKGMYNFAVNYFQDALKYDSADFRLWECLGDAYFQRGSFTSARECFVKSLLINSSSFYSAFQIAVISEKQSQYVNAIEEYTLVLSFRQFEFCANLGLARCHLALAKSLHLRCLKFQSLTHLEKAVIYATTCVKINSSFICSFKCLGDSLFLLCQLTPSSIVNIRIPRRLVDLESDSLELIQTDRLKVLEIAKSMFLSALSITTSLSSLWVDLAIVTFAMLQYAIDNTDILVKECMQFCRQSIKRQPSSDLAWCNLGMMMSHAIFSDFPLAQHCLIKAVQLNPSNAIAWCGLGFLYARTHNWKPAERCFQEAIRSNPLYGFGWVGKALHQDQQNISCLDTYAHACFLIDNSASTLRYTFHSFKYAVEMKNKYQKNIYVSKVSDSLSRSLIHKPNNFYLCYYLGAMYQLQNLHESASQMFTTALNVMPECYENLSQELYSRILQCICWTKNLKLSMACFEKTQKTLPDQMFLALCAYLCNEFSQALTICADVLSICTNSLHHADVFAVMFSFMYYGDTFDLLSEDLCAKFNDSRNMQISEDTLRFLLIFKELTSIDLNIDTTKIQSTAIKIHLSFVKSLLHSDFVQCKNILQHSLHQYPHEGKLWEDLFFCLHISDLKKCSAIKKITRKLNSMRFPIKEAYNVASEMLSGGISNECILDSFKLAQHAVLSNPSDIRTWTSLSSCCIAQSVLLTFFAKNQQSKDLIKQALKICDVEVDYKLSRTNSWLKCVQRCFCLCLSGEISCALDLCEFNLSSLNSKDETYSAFCFIHSLCKMLKSQEVVYNSTSIEMIQSRSQLRDLSMFSELSSTDMLLAAASENFKNIDFWKSFELLNLPSSYFFLIMFLRSSSLKRSRSKCISILNNALHCAMSRNSDRELKIIYQQYHNYLETFSDLNEIEILQNKVANRLSISVNS